MLAPRHVIFTSVEGALLDSGLQSWAPAADALDEISRRRIPLILATHGTRAELEPFRRKIEHRHPFITEGGGGLFLPDGYFSLALAGAARAGRYFCVPFGKPYATATEALAEIAAEARASVVGYSQMSARELAQNTGASLRDAELARQREFSERFFFVGDVEKAAERFAKIAQERRWDALPGDPFWELRSGNDDGRAVRYAMRLYRTSMRSRLSSVGIGSSAADLPLLLSVDHPIILPGGPPGEPPGARNVVNAELAARVPNATLGEAAGALGWNQAVSRVVEGPLRKQ
jgi:mannosyl-3-phosphoglycerate phosphatase family protein